MPLTVTAPPPPSPAGADHLDILIERPHKGERDYAIALQIRDPKGRQRIRRIGVERAEFPLPHHEIWDSVLPLMYLSRNGGPLFGKPVTRARVRAEYPLHAAVAAFFTRRAADFGLDLTIDTPTFERVYDVRTRGDIVLFGGGKDSRLMLGTLRETGRDPRVICARGSTFARDIPGVLSFETHDFAMPNRIVPALMLCPRHVWHGSGLGEVHLNRPWQQYFDISAPPALADTSALLQGLGFDITFHVPQCVLPYNLTQIILARRYPGLYAGQISVTPHATSDKNLHVTLLKLYHGLDPLDHCQPDLLARLLADFIGRAMTPDPAPFGRHRNREVIEREMRAIILRLHQRGLLNLPAGLAPPDDWDEPWIDHIHAYCNPGVDPALMAIYRKYAEAWPPDRPGLPQGLAAWLPAGAAVA